MAVKMVFPSGQLLEEVDTSEPEGFEVKGKEHMVSKLKNLSMVSNKPLINGF